MTNRDAHLDNDVLVNCKDIVQRADRPTAKQIAVIWLEENGLAPKIEGSLFLNDDNYL